ncbi:MAG: hypothetical protein KKA07_08570 [Bacteroidetes bacterium]|nr:hypothetical protein [Bacteroidota bacterium]MBU1719115.1 hypothetical protein [Bacteroidota bacterium]
MKKSNTVSQNNDALRVILIIAFVLLILWAVGLWGFGLGSLIYVLLVIALALLILWLVQMV